MAQAFQKIEGRSTTVFSILSRSISFLCNQTKKVEAEIASTNYQFLTFTTTKPVLRLHCAKQH